tara:strand:+ start:17269 stop:17670 length:402 start_codon:yes stop_codon:yes gene_type:complete
MSANNRRVRRFIVEILWEHGPLTKEGVAEKLSSLKNVRAVPSPHSLSALLSKNPQIVAVGSEQVENAVGVKASHLLYDVDREVIHNRDEIVYTRSPTVMTPKQREMSQQCTCGRIRIFPAESKVCLHCVRKPQ